MKAKEVIIIQSANAKEHEDRLSGIVFEVKMTHFVYPVPIESDFALPNSMHLGKNPIKIGFLFVTIIEAI